MNTSPTVLLLPVLLFGLVVGLPLCSIATLRQLSRESNDSLSGIGLTVATGFLIPVSLLLAWEFWLYPIMSFNVISVLWLVCLATGLGGSRLPFPRSLKGFAAGLLSGCAASFALALFLAALD
jgi:hypothetical protein